MVCVRLKNVPGNLKYGTSLNLFKLYVMNEEVLFRPRTYLIFSLDQDGQQIDLLVNGMAQKHFIDGLTNQFLFSIGGKEKFDIF